MIGKLLKGKDSKKGSYFLELDDIEGSQPSASEATEAKPEAAPQAVVAETAEAPVTEETAPASKAKAKSKGKVKAASKVEAKVAAPTPVAKAKSAEPAIANFATDYLMPTATKIRRTPGPSMGGFIDMARQVGK